MCVSATLAPTCFASAALAPTALASTCIDPSSRCPNNTCTNNLCTNNVCPSSPCLNNPWPCLSNPCPNNTCPNTCRPSNKGVGTSVVGEMSVGQGLMGRGLLGQELLGQGVLGQGVLGQVLVVLGMARPKHWSSHSLPHPSVGSSHFSLPSFSPTPSPLTPIVCTECIFAKSHINVCVEQQTALADGVDVHPKHTFSRIELGFTQKHSFVGWTLLPTDMF